MTGTDVQGYVKRELSDVWVPAQLWVINKGSDGYYTLQNPNSRTYLDLRMFSTVHALESRESYSWNCTGSGADGAAIEGFNPTGADYQKWVIARSKNNTSYVYVLILLLSKSFLNPDDLPITLQHLQQSNQEYVFLVSLAD